MFLYNSTSGITLPSSCAMMFLEAATVLVTVAASSRVNCSLAMLFSIRAATLVLMVPARVSLGKHVIGWKLQQLNGSLIIRQVFHHHHLPKQPKHLRFHLLRKKLIWCLRHIPFRYLKQRSLTNSFLWTPQFNSQINQMPKHPFIVLIEPQHIPVFQKIPVTHNQVVRRVRFLYLEDRVSYLIFGYHVILAKGLFGD